MIHSPKSTYWRNKADKEVTKYYSGLPCVVCGSDYMTCGHHVVSRSISAYLRHHPFNIIALCPTHHKFSNELAAHSKNPLAQVEFVKWLKKNMPKGYNLLRAYKQFRTEPYNYEENYNEWKELNGGAE